ncbi:hypothetical protein YC2023_094835 [Brassica napus]
MVHPTRISAEAKWRSGYVVPLVNRSGCGSDLASDLDFWRALSLYSATSSPVAYFLTRSTILAGASMVFLSFPRRFGLLRDLHSGDVYEENGGREVDLVWMNGGSRTRVEAIRGIERRPQTTADAKTI